MLLEELEFTVCPTPCKTSGILSHCYCYCYDHDHGYGYGYVVAAAAAAADADDDDDHDDDDDDDDDVDMCFCSCDVLMITWWYTSLPCLPTLKTAQLHPSGDVMFAKELECAAPVRSEVRRRTYGLTGTCSLCLFLTGRLQDMLCLSCLLYRPSPCRYVVMSFLMPATFIVVSSLMHLLLTLCWRSLDLHHLYRTSSGCEGSKFAQPRQVSSLLMQSRTNWVLRGYPAIFGEAGLDVRSVYTTPCFFWLSLKLLLVYQKWASYCLNLA